MNNWWTDEDQAAFQKRTEKVAEFFGKLEVMPEVYVDGNYVGVTPCSFKKVAGAHVITLRKSGYTTRSYTVQVDSADKDITFSFADLIERDSVSENNSERALSTSGLVNDIINSVLGVY